MKKPEVQVVNENDEVVGHKDRLELKFNQDIYRVAALWLRNTSGEVLIARRTLNKDRDPGLWGPAVAGTVDKGETYETNIYKEAEEEIGLIGVNFEIGPKQRVCTPRNYFCQWYLAVVDRGVDTFVLQEDEVDEVTWIPEEELKKDIENNPEKYIPAMPEVMGTLYGN